MFHTCLSLSNSPLAAPSVAEATQTANAAYLFHLIWQVVLLH